MDGLKGLPDAVEAVFPKVQVQLCVVHKVRNALKYVTWKELRGLLVTRPKPDNFDGFHVFRKEAGSGMGCDLKWPTEIPL